MAESYNFQDVSLSPVRFSDAAEKCVLVCHNKTCRKQGAPEVLKAFQAFNLSEVQVINCGCLGKCGSGPMVLVMPAEVWYGHVSPADVSSILEQQLGKKNKPQ
jgi:(2Fe-2S) ferredoxin